MPLRSSRASWSFFASLVIASLAACGDAAVTPGSDAAASPDAPRLDGASTDLPITAPADTWTWVPIAGSKCVHGAETGLAVNLHPGATRLMVFLQGGGSCTTCWGKTETDKVGTPTRYDATTFAHEPDLNGQLLLRRDADNPLADANLVFIPYCTGDAHGGTATRSELGGDGATHQDMFWGAIDLDLFLRRLVPTFPVPSRVWLAGSSAGGIATTINYARVRAAFGVRTDVINDSGEPIVPLSTAATEEAREIALWGITPPTTCATCGTKSGLYAYNRALDPTARFALLSHDYDAVIGDSNFGPAAQNPDYLTDFHAALHAFIDGLDASGHALVIGNAPDTASHVVMNKAAYRGAVGRWLAQMVDDDADWANLTVAP